MGINSWRCAPELRHRETAGWGKYNALVDRDASDRATCQVSALPRSITRAIALGCYREEISEFDEKL